MAAITSAASGNWSATTTWTGGVVPIEGDTVTIQDTHTVTIDQNITIGADTTTAAISIAAGGKLQLLSTAAADYILTCKGDLFVTGTLEVGTTAAPIPSTRKFTIKLNYSATLLEGEFGLKVVTGSTLTIQGAPMTADRCKLNTDEAALETILGVDTNTGWLVGDEIGIASTTRTYSQCEKRTLSVAASATQLTITAGLTNAHSGTLPTQAEVINLTRNIKITAYDTAYVAFYLIYHAVAANITLDFDWVEISYSQGTFLENNGSGQSININRCSFHDLKLRGVMLDVYSGASYNVTLQNNVLYNCPSAGIAHEMAHGITVGRVSSSNTLNNCLVDNNILMLSELYSAALGGLYIVQTGCSVTNNTIIGVETSGLWFDKKLTYLSTYSGNIIHSCGSYGLNLSRGWNGSLTISDLTIWRCNNYGILLAADYSCNLIISTATLFGNLTNNIYNENVSNVLLESITSNGDSSFATTNGIFINKIAANLKLLNCNFSTASGIKTAHTTDINLASLSYCQIVLNNTILAAGIENNLATNAQVGSYVKSQKHDQTAGLHKSWFKYGMITIDSTYFKTAAPSQSLTPNNAANKLESGSKKSAVANAGTITFSVWIRKSSVAAGGADYNGTQPRLVLKKNIAAGIIADTVLDTAIVALDVWEQLTGTTAAVTDDAVLEAVIDCDGTAGFVNVDDWSVS